MDKSVSIVSQEKSLVEHREEDAEPETVAKEVVVTEPRGYVGIDCLIEQAVHQTIGDGYIFNLLIVGEPGVGKTTFIDSLLDFKERREGPTLGDSFQRVVEYIDHQMENRLNDKLLVRREADFGLKDSLIHCYLYLLPPVGHGIRSVDTITMKVLQDKVNLISIIAKADGLTQSELLALKQTIRREIDSNHIQVYAFLSDGEPAEEAKKLPYAVVGSHDFHCVRNKQVRESAYNWGFVEVDSDLIKSRRKLFGETLLTINFRVFALNSTPGPSDTTAHSHCAMSGQQSDEEQPQDNNRRTTTMEDVNGQSLLNDGVIESASDETLDSSDKSSPTPSSDSKGQPTLPQDNSASSCR